MTNQDHAFPRGDERHGGHTGMRLRDYFAARAMVVFLTDAEIVQMSGIAQAAYRMADAMMEARKK